MKRYTFFMLFIAVMGCFYQSCQKDNFGVKPSEGGAFGINSSHYDSFGEQLEQTISQAIANQAFKEILIDRVNEMPLGDTEILLSSFLSQTVEGSSETTMDILLDYAKEEFAKEDLERFLASFPSVVIASRGPSWNRAKGAGLPPVVFLNSSFDEKMTSLEGSQEGEKIQVDASQAFKSTVIAIHLSERHDREGTPYYLTEAGDPNRLALQTKETPIIDLGGFDDAVKAQCIEPTTCRTVTINSFDVVPQNGALFISYSVNIPSTITCKKWVRIKIFRTNPDGTVTTTYKNGDSLPAFYDTNITPGVQYSYRMEAYLHYIQGQYPTGGWVVCDIDTAGPINVNAPSIGGPVEYYNGENISNTRLLYTWQPPSAGATEYQLRRWVDDHWEEVALLPGTQTYYEYSYPASDRNNSVIMSVRYKGSGPWSESIFDETKGSFRNPGSDLYFHGMHFPDAANFEQNGGESPFLGNPEFRILASKANTSSSVTIIQEKVVPTGRCLSTETWEEWGYDQYDYYTQEEDYYREYNEDSDYYFPKDGSVPIIQGWQSDLYGQYITIEVSETDIMEITATGEQLTEANSKSLSAKIGLKVLGFGFGLGYSQTTQTKETTKIFYPNSDQNAGYKIYTYNEPMAQVADGLIFGPEYILGGDMCCYFSERVDDIVLCDD